MYVDRYENYIDKMRRSRKVYNSFSTGTVQCRYLKWTLYQICENTTMDDQEKFNLERFNHAMKTTYAYLKSEAPLYQPDHWVRIEQTMSEEGIVAERISACEEPPEHLKS